MNYRGYKQFNFNMMKQNVLNEINDPLFKRCNIATVNPNIFTADPTTKLLKVGPSTKQYGLVFDKRVIDPITFMSLLISTSHS